MKSENDVVIRTIHPEALKEITLEGVFVILGVAHDLRDGTIPPENYNQTTACGSSCCIYGHIKNRWSGYKVVRNAWQRGSSRELTKLFHSCHPSDPQLAANAIEQYIYNHSKTPWEDAQTIG